MYLQIADILSEQYNIPVEKAVVISNNYLKALRKCPDNIEMPLDIWRQLLWHNALGEDYNQIASKYLCCEITNNLIR